MYFKIYCDPPRVTAQEKGVYVTRDRWTGKQKPKFYEKADVRTAKMLFLAELLRNKPDKPFEGPVELYTIWTFRRGKSHKDGEFKTTRPDTDNLIKLFKDCMTKAGFWQDDSQVAMERTIKIWGDEPGIEVDIYELPKQWNGRP